MAEIRRQATLPSEMEELLKSVDPEKQAETIFLLAKLFGLAEEVRTLLTKKLGPEEIVHFNYGEHRLLRLASDNYPGGFSSKKASRQLGVGPKISSMIEKLLGLGLLERGEKVYGRGSPATIIRITQKGQKALRDLDETAILLHFEKGRCNKDGMPLGTPKKYIGNIAILVSTKNIT